MATIRIDGSSSVLIDKDTPIPYHYQLRELFRGEINSGRWKVGEQFPSERELCEAYDLSRTTVREAINALVNEGLLRRERGRGTFISEPKILEGLLQTPSGFYDSLAEQGYQVLTQVMRQEITVPPVLVAHELNMKPGEQATVLDRLRFILGEPLVFVTSYVPLRLAPDLVHDDLTNKSLYQTLETKYNLKPTTAKRFMEAVAANENETKLFGVRLGSPLMLIESTTYHSDGTPMEYFKARHHGDRTRFIILTNVQTVPKNDAEIESVSNE